MASHPRFSWEGQPFVYSDFFHHGLSCFGKAPYFSINSLINKIKYLHRHLLFGEVIYHFVCKSPDPAEKNTHLDSIELKQAAWEVPLHYLNNLLDLFIAHLGRSDTLQIENRSPVFNFTWSHSMVDHMVKEKSSCFHDKVNFRLKSKVGKMRDVYLLRFAKFSCN